MKGLLTKEFITLKKQSRTTLIFVLIFVMMGILNETPSMMVMIPFFIGVWQSNVLADEISKWQQYSITLPYGRKNIISAKYLYIAIISLCSASLVMLCYTISVLAGKISSSLDEFLIIAFTSIIAGIAYPALLLPLSYKFNSEKGRTIIMIVNGFAGGTFVFLSMNEKVFGAFAKLVNITEFLPFIAFAVVIVLYLISWQISVKVYEKRDL